MSKKVLFLSHYAGRTGAPLILLQLLRWMKAHTDIPFETVLLAGGGLLSDFFDAGQTTLIAPGKADRYISALCSFAGLKKRQIPLCYSRFAGKARNKDIGLVYANTITTGAMLEALSHLACPVLCHVHEQQSLINHFGAENMAMVKRHTVRYIAVSEKVKNNLIAAHGISGDAIDVVYPFITPPAAAADPAYVRALCGIPNNAFVVGASGQGIPWIKGKDLFIQLAYVISRTYPDIPVHFIWVGGEKGGTDSDLLQHDIVAAGLAGRVHLFPDVANPLDYMNAIDVFALVSREDSFPLACLEAAALGKPILCFDRGGSMPEFVQDDAGIIIPYLDINTMADRAVMLRNNPDLSSRLGRQASAKVRSRHNSPNACLQILGIIEKLLPSLRS